MTDSLPTLFIPHGGGPCFFMDGLGPKGAWDQMAAYLRGIAATLPVRPRAILVVSGHWETPRPSVTTSPAPPLLYDYYGFPPHTYQLRYPAPGAPALADRVRALLDAAGIASDTDPARGFDHGVFIPMMLAFPDADIPIVQLSLQAGRDPDTHLRIGAALAHLRHEGVLIVGSGMSYHNMRGYFSPDPAHGLASDRFDAWLTDAVTDPDPARRNALLAHWSEAPGARAAHPEEEHLLPLMVAAGAAGPDRGVRRYSDRSLGVSLSGFAFG